MDSCDNAPLRLQIQFTKAEKGTKWTVSKATPFLDFGLPSGSLCRPKSSSHAKTRQKGDTESKQLAA